MIIVNLQTIYQALFMYQQWADRMPCFLDKIDWL